MTNTTDRLASAKRIYSMTAKVTRRGARPTFRRWLRSSEAKVWFAPPLRNGELDFRGPDGTDATWRPWEPGRPFNIGSGRRAHWEAVNYVRYSVIARLLHDRLRWSGQRVRNAAHCLAKAIDAGWSWQPPAEEVPALEMARLAIVGPHPQEFVTMRRHEEDTTDDLYLRRLQWRLWLARVVVPAWGDFMLAHIRRRLELDPSYRTPSYVVGEIRRLRGADVTDLRGCSGCEHLDRIAALSEAEQDALLARAGTATRVQLKCGLVGYYVPFGLDCPTEYDQVLVLGLSYEVRVRSNEYAALRPDQVAQVLR